MSTSTQQLHCLLGIPHALLVLETVQAAMTVQIVLQLKSAECEEVELTLDRKQLSLRSSKSKSMMTEIQISLPPEPGNGKLCLYAEGKSQVQATFSFRHFERVGRLCKAGCKVLLQMADDAPLSIVCDLVDGGACQMFLAPLLDSE